MCVRVVLVASNRKSSLNLSLPSIHVSPTMSASLLLCCSSLMTARWLLWFQASHLHTPLSRRREELLSQKFSTHVFNFTELDWVICPPLSQTNYWPGFDKYQDKSPFCDRPLCWSLFNKPQSVTSGCSGLWRGGRGATERGEEKGSWERGSTW